MTRTTPAAPTVTTRVIKTIFKGVLAIHTALYRLAGGAIGHRFRGGTLLLLTTTGRKSGKSRTLPVMYFRDGDDVVVVASNGGMGPNPAWYHNLKHRPEATVQILRQQVQVRAEEAQGEERTRLWKLVLAQAPFFAHYESKVQREIPLMILRPQGTA